MIRIPSPTYAQMKNTTTCVISATTSYQQLVNGLLYSRKLLSRIWKCQKMVACSKSTYLTQLLNLRRSQKSTESKVSESPIKFKMTNWLRSLSKVLLSFILEEQTENLNKWRRTYLIKSSKPQSKRMIVRTMIRMRLMKKHNLLLKLIWVRNINFLK